MYTVPQKIQIFNIDKMMLYSKYSGIFDYLELVDYYHIFYDKKGMTSSPDRIMKYETILIGIYMI